MSKKSPEMVQYHFLTDLGLLYKNEEQVLQLGLQLAPDVMGNLKQWSLEKGRPQGNSLMVDLQSGKGIIFNPHQSPWKIEGRFDDFTPMDAKKYAAAICVSVGILSPKESEANLEKIAGKLIQRGRGKEAVLGRFFILELVSDIPDNNGLERRRKLLSERLGLVKTEIALDENPLLKKGSMFNPVTGLLQGKKMLMWEARMERPAEKPEKAKLEKTLRSIIFRTNRKYKHLGFRVVNENELRVKLDKVENYWIWKTQLNEGEGIRLACRYGCLYDLGQAEFLQRCPTHPEEADIAKTEKAEPVPEYQISIRQMDYAPLSPEFNLENKTRITTHQCGYGVPACNLPLVEDTRLDRVTGEGYRLLVNYVCPQYHGDRFKDTIIADGPDKKHLKTIRVINRSFKVR